MNQIPTAHEQRVDLLRKKIIAFKEVTGLGVYWMVNNGLDVNARTVYNILNSTHLPRPRTIKPIEDWLESSKYYDAIQKYLFREHKS